MICRQLFALGLVAAVGCGSSNSDESASKAAGNQQQPAAKAAKTPPAEAAPTAEGQIVATIGGTEKTFAHLDSDSNAVLATNFILAGQTEAGGEEELRIVGTGLTIPTDGPFPLTLTTEPAEVYMKRHQAHLAGKGPRTLQKRLNIMYTTGDGTRYVSASNASLVVTSFESGVVVGTLSPTTLTARKAEPLELTAGSVKVTAITPAAGRAVEKAVTGE